MRICGLTIENFLAHRSLALDIEKKVAVFVGRNGGGKSSILDGIRAALTGTARGLARKDAGLLGAWGSKSWAVDLVLEHADAEGTVRRTPTKLYAVDGVGVKHELSQGKANEVLLGGEPGLVDATFDVWKALGMTPDERRALVCRVAGVRADAEELQKLGFSGEPLAAALAGDWRKAERLCAEEKRAARRAIDEIPVVQVEDRLVGMPGNEMRCSEVDAEPAILEDCYRALDEERKKERELVHQMGMVQGRAEASAETIRDEITAHEEALDEYKPVEEYRVQRSQHEKAVNEEKAILSEVQLTKEERAVRDAREGLRNASAIRDRVRDWSPGCTCGACGNRHERTGAPSSEQKMAAAEAVKVGEAKLKEAEEILAQGQKFRDEHQKALQMAEARLHEVTERMKERAEHARLLEEARKKASEPAGPKPEDLQAQADAAREKAAQIQVIIDTVEAYNRAKNQRQGNDARKGQLLVSAGVMEKLEHLCRPDGIQARLMAKTVAPIRDAMATLSGRVFGAREGVQAATIDDDFSPMVVDRDGVTHPVETLNGSVRWRVGLCLAHSLAQLSGLRILLLDEINTLDQENQDALLLALNGIADQYDQVLVAATPWGFQVQGVSGDLNIGIYYVEPNSARLLNAGEEIIL